MMIIFGVITLGLIAWGLWIATYNDTPAPTQPTRHDDGTYDYPNYYDAAGYNRIARRQTIADAMTDAELIRILRVHQSLIRDERDLIEHWIKCIQRESWPIDPDDKYADYIAKSQADEASKARTSARRWIAHPVYEFLWSALEQR